MSSPSDPMQLPEAIVNALGKATTDPAYRQQLLTDPAKAGVSPVGGTAYKFIEPSADKFYLVLPPAGSTTVPSTAAQLADADEALTAMAAACGADPKVRAEVLADPRAAITKMGLDVPSDVKVVALENTATQTHVVLPSPTASGDEELSDAELESVAGGIGLNIRIRGLGKWSPPRFPFRPPGRGGKLF